MNEYPIMGQTIHQTLWSLVCEESIVLCIYGFYIILRKRGQCQRPLPIPPTQNHQIIPKCVTCTQAGTPNPDLMSGEGFPAET